MTTTGPTKPGSTHAVPGRRTVRPRWIWGGIVVLLAGTTVLGIGVSVTSWTWSTAGLVVMALGAASAWGGGVMYDARTSAAVQAEISDVVDGNVHRGVAPGDTVSTPTIRQTSRHLDHRRKALERASIEAPRPSLVPPVGGLLMLVALFLLVSQWGLYPVGLPGQTNATRSLGCAIVLALVGLRILTAQADQRLRLSSGLAALAGLVLILNGCVARHDRLATSVVEVVCGALCWVAVAVVLAHEPR